MYNFFFAKISHHLFTVKYLLTNFIVPSYKVLLFFKIKVDSYLQQWLVCIRQNETYIVARYLALSLDVMFIRINNVGAGMW